MVGPQPGFLFRRPFLQVSRHANWPPAKRQEAGEAQICSAACSRLVLLWRCGQVGAAGVFVRHCGWRSPCARCAPCAQCCLLCTISFSSLSPPALPLMYALVCWLRAAQPQPPMLQGRPVLLQRPMLWTRAMMRRLMLLLLGQQLQQPRTAAMVRLM